jgi:hypothetical protein
LRGESVPPKEIIQQNIIIILPLTHIILDDDDDIYLKKKLQRGCHKMHHLYTKMQTTQRHKEESQHTNNKKYLNSTIGAVA